MGPLGTLARKDRLQACLMPRHSVAVKAELCKN